MRSTVLMTALSVVVVPVFSLLLAGPVLAKTDTLKHQTPGDLIGCDYTFQNGDPSIPCAKDKVAPDGTVSFVKPNANYDNIEYFDVTTGKDIVALFAPENTAIITQLTAGTEYPILSPSFGSFFDVFVTIQVEPFNADNQDLIGNYVIGQTFQFTNGTSSDLPNVSIGDYTGSAVISGFDDVTAAVPEPASWALILVGFGGIGATMRRRETRKDTIA